MSASLVGSEMCIRDRQRGGPGALFSLASRAPRAKACADCGLADCGVEPVSYTHLTLPTICSV
eukprot:2805947-Alexandrium_andersonii.AAC.1